MNRSKYGNKKTIVDDITFDSKREAKRYMELLLLQKAGEVNSFELQKIFYLNDHAKTKREQIKYICDFFVKWSNGKETVEDAKGFRTEIYKLKKKLFETKYRIPIIEI